jgi:biofilm protein TabA
MILDDLASAARYESLHRLFRLGFEFFSQSNLAELYNGRYELDGERMVASIDRGVGRGRASTRLEAHRKYIDIQFLVDGTEEIGWRSLDECQKIGEPYDATRDVIFFADAPQTWMELPRGKFVIFFPEDAHATRAATGPYHKAVVKVAVE